MSKEYIKDRRKRNKKTLYNISVGPMTDQALARLFDKNPEATISNLFADAVRFADANGLYDYEKPTYDPPKPSKSVKEQAYEAKQKWFLEFGGNELEDGIGEYEAYQKSLTGKLTKRKRQINIANLPTDREDLRRRMLGPFATLQMADEAYEAQQEQYREANQKKNGE